MAFYYFANQNLFLRRALEPDSGKAQFPEDDWLAEVEAGGIGVVDKIVVVLDLCYWPEILQATELIEGAVADGDLVQVCAHDEL